MTPLEGLCESHTAVDSRPAWVRCVFFMAFPSSGRFLAVCDVFHQEVYLSPALKGSTVEKIYTVRS